MTVADVPWGYVSEYDHHKGKGDLIFLVKGFYYLSDFLTGPDDLDGVSEIWWSLRGDFVAEHARRRPHSRPWAWWTEDRVPRRRLSEGPCNCVALPDIAGKFPRGSTSWFGKPGHWCQSGFETQGEFLSRLGLLLPGENAEQHGQI